MKGTCKADCVSITFCNTCFTFIKNKLPKKAIKGVSSLPDIEQDEIARIILDEIEDEKLWQKQFESTQDELLIMAHEALKEEKSGKTKELRL